MRQLIARIRKMLGRPTRPAKQDRPYPLQLLLLALFAAAPVIIGIAILNASGGGGAPHVASAGPDLVSPDELRALAPRRLAGLERISADVDISSTLGVNAVVMEAAYRKGDSRLQLTIVHSTAIEQVIGFGGVDTEEYDRAEPNGYSRRRREGETLIIEQWNGKQEAGAYGRLLRGRYYVFASGKGVAERDLRDAVNAFSAQRLETLPRGS